MTQARWGTSTDGALLTALQRAAKQPVSHEEIVAQRVSFVYGSVSSSANGVTREKIRQMILQEEGGLAEGSR